MYNRARVVAPCACLTKPGACVNALFLFCGEGKVIKGMAVVHQIENVKVDKNDRPTSPIRIESVSVHFT